VRGCTLKNKDLDFVVRNAPVLVVDMQRKWEIASERLWMVATHQFSYSPLEELL
jgi:hypothetical protein